MPKPDVSQPFRLRETGQVRDRNTRQAEDGIDTIEFQGIDHEMKPVRDRVRIYFVFHLKPRVSRTIVNSIPIPNLMLRRSRYCASGRSVRRCSPVVSAPRRYAPPAA